MIAIVRETQAETGRRLRGREGFTLIEALVAFAVLALLTVVLQRGIIGAAVGTSRAEARMEAGMVARTLMTTRSFGGGEMPASGRVSGRMNDRDWTVRFEPLALAAGAPGESASSVFRPMRMVIEVALDERGVGSLSVETVRLVRVPAGQPG